MVEPRWRAKPPEDLEPDQRALYDAIVSGPRGAQASVPLLGTDRSLVGPFGVMALAPRVGSAVQEVGAALRFGSTLGDVVREAAILLVAVARDCEFEWIAHQTPARQAGLTDEQLRSLRAGRVPSGLAAPVAHTLTVVQGLLGGAALGAEEFASATAELGESQVAELVWLVGYYSMLALALATFAPPVPNLPDSLWGTTGTVEN